MRFLRALFLTVVSLLLLVDLAVLQVGVGIDRTVLNPGFVLATMDRTHFYDAARDLMVTGLAPPPGTASPAEAKIVAAAVAEALTPDLLRAQAQVIVPQVYALVEHPTPAPAVTVDLTAFRENLLAAMEKLAREAGATARQLASVRAGVKSAIPAKLDLLQQLQVDPARLAELTTYYRYFHAALAGTGVLMLVLALLAVWAAGRRAWGAWLGVPFILSGLAVGTAATVARSRALALLSDPQALGWTGNPDAGQVVVAGLGQGVANGLWLAFLLIGTTAAVVGAFLWFMARKAYR